LRWKKHRRVYHNKNMRPSLRTLWEDNEINFTVDW
jgi:hypothetical protein